MQNSPSTNGTKATEEAVTARMAELQITGHHTMGNEAISSETHMAAMDVIAGMVERRKSAGTEPQNVLA